MGESRHSVCTGETSEHPSETFQIGADDFPEDTRSRQDWTNATESSLTMVRAAILEKQRSIEKADAEKADALRKEIQLLKLQQARLAGALWYVDASQGNNVTDS